MQFKALSKNRNLEFLKEFYFMLLSGKINIIKMTIEDDLMINGLKKELNMDFDDALQFIAANRKKTCIVTYDKDFKRKGVEVKTPKQILKKIIK